MSRDRTSALRKFDRSAMLVRMGNTPSRLNAPQDCKTTFPNSFDRPRNVVIGGVGGSGIAGDIVADYLKAVGDVPISVCRALQIPGHVEERTLFLAISYSGETRETLSLLEQAVKRKAMLASVTSGGTLLSTCVARRIPYLKVPAGLPPRVALPS
jgi:glucose/mannose-6-phosphate isomerase